MAHIGDFSMRMAEHCHALYDYTPIPPLSYPELKDEIWCHRYYLRKLVDETRFPGWPVVDHILLVQSLLVAWREELAREPLSMTDNEARNILQVTNVSQSMVCRYAQQACVLTSVVICSVGRGGGGIARGCAKACIS